MLADISSREFVHQAEGPMPGCHEMFNVPDRRHGRAMLAGLRRLGGKRGATVTKPKQLAGFHALVTSDKSGSSQLEDVDGDYRYWDKLSAAGKVRQIARNAAYYDVPFTPFAEAVRDAIGSI